MVVVKLTEECSAAILNQPPKKKEDSGCPTINSSIGTQHFGNALCDLGASVSVMPKVVFDKLNLTHLTPTPMHLQLADSSVRYLEGIAEDVPFRVRDYFIPVDFVVLDMEISKETPLILGRPFLSTTGAHINGKEEKFPFRPKKEQCLLINTKSGPTTQKEAEVTSPDQDQTTTRTTRTSRMMWRKVASSFPSNSPGRVIQW
jgi:hypothetical protein